MRKRLLKKLCAVSLASAMVLGLNGITDLQVQSAGAAKVKAPVLNEKTIVLGIGNKQQIMYTTTSPKVVKESWKSKNKKVATVTKKGKITAVKLGTAKLTGKVTYKKGKKKVTKSMKLTVKVNAPKLVSNTANVKVGDTTVLTVANKPVKATITWKSANTKVATVNDGIVKGIAEGKTTVSAKVVYKNGKASKTTNLSATVVVSKKAPATEPTVPKKQLTEEEIDALAKESNLTSEHKSASGLVSKDNGKMRTDLSSLDLINHTMGLGWNLGNQLEQSNCLGMMDTIKKCEMSAGNPLAKQVLFDGLKSYGINTVRIPVAWSNFLTMEIPQADGKVKKVTGAAEINKELKTAPADTYYRINPELMERVETVINYALNDEMYVIFNIHWDGGWWGQFGAEEYDGTPLAKTDIKKTPIRYQAYKRYTDMWKQISERFKEYSDHIIFEGANEELSGRLNDDYTDPIKGQTGQTGKLGKDANDIYKIVNDINQTFVNVVRNSGGNNKYRHLLIPGTGHESCVIGGYAGDYYETDGTMDDRYKMPTDSKENGNSKLSVSVHYYDPTDYGISATSATPWGYRNSWGTEEDYKYMKENMGRMQKFTEQGYGVILGECGCVKGYKDNVIDYLKEMFNLSKEMGYCPVLWDEGHYFVRGKGYFQYEDVGTFYANYTGNPVPQAQLDAKKLLHTGIPVMPTSENQNPKVVATWSGHFMRHLGDPEYQKFSTDPNYIYKDLLDAKNHGIGIINEEDNCKSEIDKEFWNVHVTTDWSKIKEPVVRVYPDDQEESSKADLQVGYLQTKETGFAGDTSYDPGNGLFWVGKYLKLDPDYLSSNDQNTEEDPYPWLWITTNNYNGASYMKIEICDAAYNADGSEFVKGESVSN